jgi:D-serine deaminase-like pyridoxal phosphate-dependent protein
VRQIATADGLTYRGLLTHAGQSYGAAPAEAARVFTATRDQLDGLRAGLAAAGLPGGELSAGDTPGFAAVRDWSGLDEARPGNFVFYDLMQLATGACGPEDLACAVAAPVIGVYPERAEIVVHAGAVHLSKDALTDTDGHAVYGRLLTMTAAGFGPLADGGVVTSLSQEHGVISLPQQRDAEDFSPGDLVLVAPVHSCLTCEQYSGYLTPAGERLARYSSTGSSSSPPDSASRSRGGSTKNV